MTFALAGLAMWAVVAACTALLGTPRRGAAVAVAAVGLGLPWLAPAVPVLRAVFGLATAWHLARVVELAIGPPGPTVAARLWHQLGVVDTRRAVHGDPRLDRSALGRVALGGAVAGAGWAVVGVPSSPLQWLGGAALVYGLAEAVFATLHVAYGLVGVTLPPLHRDPVLARSVGEFWGARWNLVIGGWLREQVYRPLATAGRPGWAVVASFFVSALLHLHFAVAGAGVATGLTMAAFFVVQGGVVAVEPALRVRAWPAIAGHAWTIGWMLATMPLFVGPFLQLFSF